MIDTISSVSIGFAALSLATGASLTGLRNARWRLALETATVLFTGAMSVILGAGRLIDAVALRVTGEWAHEFSHRIPPDVVWIAGFPYDLRFYLPALFAAIILLKGVECLRTVPGIARNDNRCRRAALSASLWLAALAVPVVFWIQMARPVALGAMIAAAATTVGKKKSRARSIPGRLVATVSAGR